MIPRMFDMSALRHAYRRGALTPEQMLADLLPRIDAYDPAVWISRVDPAALRAEARLLDASRIDELPLFGIPFAVKDNIDALPLATTAACPSFAFHPTEDSTIVRKLREAGALMLGKTNLDQFATGLNGTRSPYGAPRSVFSHDYISGGSSSGSAVAVGAGLAAFSLGTDTAGSGRVPAAYNNLIGLKPTRGRISTAGVLPACRSIDCVSVFANSAADAGLVLRVAEGLDAADSLSRIGAEISLPVRPVVGVLAEDQRDFAGDTGYAALYEAALAKAQELGWELRTFDFTPFRQAASLLYGASFVAERYQTIRTFIASRPDAMDPTVLRIIQGANGFSAADAFRDIYLLQDLRAAAAHAIAGMDIVLLPTTPTIFKFDELLAEPITNNATLGIYTNFVNFFDQAAVAVPAGFRADGLPFGVTLIGPAFSDLALLHLADQLHVALGAGAGVSRQMPTTRMAAPAEPLTKIVVAGAHLSGMVLNHELTALGARLECATTTTADYKLYALPTTPAKPGLARMPGFEGPGIAVEIWAMTPESFGKFVAALPAPMGIGKVSVADGAEYPGFLCEAHMLQSAADITSYGGWRNYIASHSF